MACGQSSSVDRPHPIDWRGEGKPLETDERTEEGIDEMIDEVVRADEPVIRLPARPRLPARGFVW